MLRSVLDKSLPALPVPCGKMKMHAPPLTSRSSPCKLGLLSSYVTVPSMARPLFVGAPSLPRAAGGDVLLEPPLRKRRRTGNSRPAPSSPSQPTASRVARVAILPSAPAHTATATRRSARVSILTDFSSNPLAAISDRAADPLSACMLVVAAALGAIVTGLAAGRAPLPAAVGPAMRAAAQAEEDGESDGEADALLLPSQTRQIGAPTPGENALWLNMRFV